MRKQLRNAKRILACMLAFSMILGEAGTHAAYVFAAQEESEEIVSGETYDIDALEEADVEEETGEATEEPAEEDILQAEDSETDSVEEQEEEAEVTLPEYETEEPTPGKVVNLRFDKKDATTGIVDTSFLSWDDVQGAESYEFRVTDGTYEYYTEKPYTVSGKIRYPYYPVNNNFYDIDNLLGNLTAYTATLDANGSWTIDKPLDAAGNPLRVVAGVPYSISVRAVNSKIGSSYLSSSAYYYGEWSDPISYTFEARPTLTLTDIQINKDGLLSFKKSPEDRVEMEIKAVINGVEREFYASYDTNDKKEVEYERPSLSPSYSGAYLTTNFEAYLYTGITKEVKCDASGAPLQDASGNPLYVKAFEEGVTYTIRLRPYNNTQSPYLYGEWSAPIVYTVPVAPTPNAVSSLRYDYNQSTPELKWSSVNTCHIDGYELDIVDAMGRKYCAADSYSAPRKLPNLTTSSTYFGLYSKWLYAYAVDADGKGIPGAGGYIRPLTDEAGNKITAFKAGEIYTVSVRAYVNANYGRRYSEPATITFTYNKRFDLRKITGVRVTPSDGDVRVQWNAQETTGSYLNEHVYQIEACDTAGRVYYYDSNSPKKNEDGTYNFDECYYNVTSNSTSNFFTGHPSSYSARLYTYEPDKNEKGEIKGFIKVINPATGNYVVAFEPGNTYTVRVRSRAVDGITKEYYYGEWSEPFTYTVPVAKSAEGFQGKPEKVTNLLLRTDYDLYENTFLSSPQLTWKNIKKISGYQFEIKDDKGNLYTEEPTYVNGAYYTDYYTSWNDNSYRYLTDFSGLHSYVLTPGSAYDYVRNADGTKARTFTAGTKYTIRVRAVNRYRTWNYTKQNWDDYTYTYGDWSSAVSYKYSGLSPVTGLHLERAEYDSSNVSAYYYFAYKTQLSDSRIFYQVASDPGFADNTIVKSWDYTTDSDNKLRLSQGNLQFGTTYYLRVVNYPRSAEKSIGSLTPEELAAYRPATVAFSTISRLAKNITGLKLYRTTNSGWQFRFDGTLDKKNGDRYELQYAYDPNATGWGSLGETTTVERSLVREGTFYVRAVAYVETADKVTGFKQRIYGAPSNIVTVTKNIATGSIGKLKLKSKTDDRYIFTYTGKVPIGQTIHLEYADNKNFVGNGKHHLSYNASSADNLNKDLDLYFSWMNAGRTYYVRARVYNPQARTDADRFSAYSNAIKVQAKLPKITIYSSRVTKDSVTLTASMTNNWSSLTGYEVYRKDGSKWVKLGKTTGISYVDKKLKANTTYIYRMRPYFYDRFTNKTTTGDWAYAEATTWGGCPNLLVKPAGKTSIKLEWEKVAGAEGYEILRYIGKHEASEKKGTYDDAYSAKYQLIKKVGPGTKSYTDKGLTQEMDYTYIVRAYKTIKGKKVTIDSSASTSLAFKLYNSRSYYKANGKVVWTWNPVYLAKGYLVEKQNTVTGKWTTYKKIKKVSKAGITLPKTTDMAGVTYRVRAYNGNKYTNSYTVTVKPVVATPTGMKAKGNAKKHSITLSWKKVKGADYYLVYRTTDLRTTYYKDRKGYTNNNVEEVPVYVKDDSQVCGYRRLTDPKDLKAYYAKQKTPSLVDARITYKYNGSTCMKYWGPKSGVTYYYYVVAVKNGKAVTYDNNYDGGNVRSYNSKAAKVKLTEAKPGAVKLSSAKAKAKKITLKYKKVKNAAGYEIVRSTNSKKGFKLVGIVNSGTKLSYVDKATKKNKLKKGKTYYYKVRAFVYDDAGNKIYGKYSKVKKVKAK